MSAREGQVKDEPVEERVPPKKNREERSSAELHIYTVEELSKFKKRELLADVTLLDGNSFFSTSMVESVLISPLEQVKNSSPNLGVLKEYRKREQEFLDRAKDLDEVTAQKDAQKNKYDGLRKQRLDEFMSGFNTISAKLKEMYQVSNINL